MKKLLLTTIILLISILTVNSQTLEIKLAKDRQYNGKFEVYADNVKVLEFNQTKTYNKFLFKIKKTKSTNGIYFYELQTSVALDEFNTPNGYNWIGGNCEKIVMVIDPNK